MATLGTEWFATELPAAELNTNAVEFHAKDGSLWRAR